MQSLSKRHFIQGISAGILSTALQNLQAKTTGPHVLGLTLPLTGPQAEVASELLVGYQTAVYGSQGTLLLRVLDDESNPEKTVANIRILASDKQVIAVSGIVGTPHAKAALPEALKLNLPVVGIRSGASSLRMGQEGVYHLRASFEQELNKVAQLCSGGGVKRVAFIYSNDSFGIASRDYLSERLNGLGLDSSIRYAVERNGSNTEQVVEAIATAIKKAQIPTAVALLMITKPMQEALVLLRSKHKIIMPVYAMSFSATRGVATSKDSAFNGLGLVSAFPIPRSASSRLLLVYREQLIAAGHVDYMESITTFEGYFYGSVVAQAARSARTRSDLTRQLESGMDLHDTKIVFNSEKVGYQHLEVIHKGSGETKFRS